MHDFDEDVPAGYRDADIEMAELTARGNESKRLRKRGICTHGWVQGQPGGRDGPIECLYCHAVFPDQAAYDNARARAFEGLLPR